MEVKIYREPENVGLLLDEEQLKEYQTLASELGIPEVNPDKIPSVYQVLNHNQTRALEALCPASIDLKNYSRSTIPVEVLQAIKFVTDNEMFDKIEVWYDDKNPDPMIIGKKYNNDNDRQKGYSWTMVNTLIARWGDCAYELPELVEMGKKRLVEEKKEKAIDLLQKINSFLEYPEIHINRYLSDGFLNFER
jgi:translation initiation factor 2 alpha subunit (eIF-2alpha)